MGLRRVFVSFLSLGCAAVVAAATSATSKQYQEPYPQQSFDNLMVDPESEVERQFAAIAPVTSDATPAAAAKWLDEVGDVMARVALGGLGRLPTGATLAVETLADVVVASGVLLQDKRVLKRVFAVAPSIWASGYWYAKPETWTPLFASVWDRSVEFAKHERESGDDSEPFDAAINATAIMVRFTKDNYFITGEPDVGADSDSALPSARAYLAFLPQVVAALSCAPHFTLSEKELRAFMNTLPSKRDGMDPNQPFASFDDPELYRASDAAALRAYIGASGAAAHT